MTATTDTARIVDVKGAGRMYQCPDGQLRASVTNILGAINKPALVPWAANQERAMVTEAAATLYAELVGKPQIEKPAFVAALTSALGRVKAHTKALAQAAEIGTQAHHHIEWMLRKDLGQVVGPAPALSPKALIAYRIFDAWRDGVRLIPQRIEQVVWNGPHGYAGTLDLLASITIDGARCTAVLDWKCLLPEQTLRCADGSMIRADEVMPGDQLLSWDGVHFRPDTVKDVFPGGTQPAVEVVTTYGRRLRVSANHPVLVNREWVHAGDLQRGMPVSVCAEWPKVAGETLATDEARLLGYLVGDGNMSDSSRRRFTAGTAEIAAHAEELAVGLGFTWAREERQAVETPSFRIGGIGSWLRHHGLYGAKSAYKTVPTDVLRGDIEIARAFLLSYFDTDGYIAKLEINRPDCVLTTISPRLAAEVQELLWRCGIAATVWRQDNKLYQNKAYATPPYWIKVTSQSAARKLLLLLDDLRDPKKRERRDAWLAKLETVAKPPRRSLGHEAVARVTPLPTQPTIAIEMTETGTFVTSGLVTHNTGKAIYPEALLQNVAYVQALAAMGHTTGPVYGVVVRLPKVDSDPEPEIRVIRPEEQPALFEAFLAVKRLWDWLQEQDRARQDARTRPAQVPPVAESTDDPFKNMDTVRTQVLADLATAKAALARQPTDDVWARIVRGHTGVRDVQAAERGTLLSLLATVRGLAKKDPASINRVKAMLENSTASEPPAPEGETGTAVPEHRAPAAAVLALGAGSIPDPVTSPTEAAMRVDVDDPREELLTAIATAKGQIGRQPPEAIWSAIVAATCGTADLTKAVPAALDELLVLVKGLAANDAKTIGRVALIIKRSQG